MTDSNEVVITADAHVGETDDLRKRLPRHYQSRLPEFGVTDDGHLDFKVQGKSYPKLHDRAPTEEDMQRLHFTPSLEGEQLQVFQQLWSEVQSR